MLSATRGLSGRSRVCLFLSIAIVTFTLSATAQEAPASQPALGIAPATSAAQPASQAATSATSLTTSPTKVPETEKETTDLSLQRLGSGDLLEVGVYNVPELATKARVSSAGDLYLPLIDYVHVEGLTVEEAQALIQAA